MARVAINGLGRIGRATLKIVLGTPGLDLVAANELAPVDDVAYLLKHDTVYGRYETPVAADDGGLAIGTTRVKVLHEKEPARLPWRELDIDIVFECTGVFPRRDDLVKHVQAGAKFVILSAPSGAAKLVPTTTGAAAATTKALPATSGTIRRYRRTGTGAGRVARRCGRPDGPTDQRWRGECDLHGGGRHRSVPRHRRRDRRAAGVIRHHQGPTSVGHRSRDDTQVVDGDLVKVLSWYDNEWGYSSQMVREAQRIAASLDRRTPDPAVAHAR